MDRRLLSIVAFGAVLALTGCEKKGPVEQAGEEVDEAITTIKEGEEPASVKMDDAVDEAREAAEQAAEEPKKD
jgi:predicted small lipoprotein YifL